MSGLQWPQGTRQALEYRVIQVHGDTAFPSFWAKEFLHYIDWFCYISVGDFDKAYRCDGLEKKQEKVNKEKWKRHLSLQLLGLTTQEDCI